MPKRCIIIEDQLPAQRILTRYLQEVPELELLATFTDPLEGLAYMRQETVDLLFLDVNLPKLSGMEFLKIMPYQPKVILTTAYSEYALEGYEYSVVDYLLKPISLERFMKAIGKVIAPEKTQEASSPPDNAGMTAQAPPTYLFVKSDRSIIKLTLSDLTHIKAEDDYTRVYTRGKAHFLSYNLKYWEETLPAPTFTRIHKSYMVNLDYIDKVEGNQVFVQAVEAALPVGRSYRSTLIERLNVRE